MTVAHHLSNLARRRETPAPFAKFGAGWNDVAVSGDLPSFLRAEGLVSIACGASGGRTRLIRLRQEGALNARFPHQDRSALEAVLINIGGGVAAGDRHTISVEVGDSAHVIVSTSAAEKIYRSPGAISRIDTRLGVKGALEWLPQETILFNEARLARTFVADVDRGANLLILETVVLGRRAMGESFRAGLMRDAWRIRREGRLVFADGLLIHGDTGSLLARAAIADGAHCFATLLHVTPDAEARLERARSAIDKLRGEACDAAASAWDGMLSARWLACDARALRDALIKFLESYRDAPPPRVWST